MSAFGDSIVQCRAILDRRFGTEPRAVHLRVLGAALLFAGLFLLGGRATVQWAIGYAGFCLGWVVIPSRKDLDRTYGARFVETVRFLFVLGLVLTVATLLTFFTLFVPGPLPLRIVGGLVALGAWWVAFWLPWRAYVLSRG